MNNNKNTYKVAIYGLKGSYTDQAANKFFNKCCKENDFVFKEKPLFPDLFDFVEEGNLAFFPIENSTGGTVVQSLDLFPDYNFEIIAEYYMDINHCLLVRPENVDNKIKKVYSHPQSLLQCSNFLNENGIETVADSDNAAAGKNVSMMKEKNVAAIGGEVLADLYNLKIVKRNFQNSKNNVTRFVLIKKKNSKLEFEEKLKKINGLWKTTITFTAKDKPGSLYKCLGAFATNSVDLTKIESRPSRNKNFGYYFLLEFKGNIDDKNVKNALEELKFFTDEYKIIGSYKEIK